MARPRKEGLDYFPHDTDADSDEKIQAMTYLYGNDGYAFYFRLLQRIYRTPLGELDISDPETRRILAGNLNLTVRKFNQILKTSLKKGLFDIGLYEISGRLSSISIKVRLRPVLEQREVKRGFYAQKGVVSTGETLEKSQRNSGETPQSKVKVNIKERESKEILTPTPLSLPLVKNDGDEIFSNKYITGRLGALVET